VHGWTCLVYIDINVREIERERERERVCVCNVLKHPLGNL